MSTDLTTAPQTEELKSRMELMQDRMDNVLDMVIAGKMDVPTAKVVNSLFQTFINSANAETAFVERTSQPLLRNALTPLRKEVKHTVEPTSNGVVHTIENNGIKSLVHRMVG